MYRGIIRRHAFRFVADWHRTSNQVNTAPMACYLSSCGGGGGCGSDTPKERFPLPDQDTELKLASIQSQITDHYKQGDFVKALEVSKKLLKQTESHFGRDHPATASAYNNIGLMQKLLGDFVEARKHYNQAMRIYGKVVGRDHASYAMTLHNLGTLSKSQVHFDTSLKATDRLSLVETALEHFEEAWAIRKAELGEEHPYTVATRSSYGSTLAAQVLNQHKYVERGKQQRQYVALNSQAVTDQGWKAAEAHLRQAMETAILNPRGRNIQNNNKGNKKKKKNDKQNIETLSAAAAAQNLAVFLKSRSMTEHPYNKQLMKEAMSLYTQVQKVRSQLLPPQHPDLYATKYSLAELLGAIGDEEAANQLRQEIIDTYDPPSQDDAISDPPLETDTLDDVPPRVVTVDKTVASKP
jgi:tetratricopeptide (TPR) repeat protein